MGHDNKLSAEEFHAFLVKTYGLTEEEGEKWDTPFITTATLYKFPKEIWGNPGVEQCIQLLMRAEMLQQDLSIANVKRKEKYWISETDREVYADAVKKRKGGKGEIENRFRPANALTAVNSFNIAEVLMRCVVAILQDGINGQKIQLDYILRICTKLCGLTSLRCLLTPFQMFSLSVTYLELIV